MFVALFFLAAFLASLGPVGLATIAAERQRKEIGIRGVLARGFLKRVIQAAVAAFLIGALAANSWLRRFAYQIEVSWPPPVAALSLALVLAFSYIVVQSW